MSIEILRARVATVVGQRREPVAEPERASAEVRPDLDDCVRT